MKRFLFTVPCVVVVILILVSLSERACGDDMEDFAAWENFIRYNPHDHRAERTFRAIVRAASSPEDYERNLEYANLVDIEKAIYKEETGELILIGPTIQDQNRGYMTPLLVVEDFTTALRVLDAIGERALGVSIGTYNYGGTPEEREQDDRLDRQPVEYFPQMISGTHMGFVFFETDRWLKNLSHGKDNYTLEPLYVNIPGYQTQAQRAKEYFRIHAGSEFAEGARSYGLQWFLPARPQVECNGYSMRFASYRMTVQYKAMTPDPAIAAFAEHMTENFDQYCKEYPVFQELIRMHKLVQIAKWYRSSGFPDDAFLDHKPLRISTPEHTRRITSSVGRFNLSNNRYVDISLVGGIDFSPPNVYVPSAAVPGTMQQRFGPPLAKPLNIQRSIAPTRFGTYNAGAAPVPAFVAPIVQARPSPTTCAWTVRIDGRTIKAIAIPVKRDAVASRSTKQDPRALALTAVPYNVSDNRNP